MPAVRGGTVDCVIVTELDRVGRSLVHLAMILDELGRLHVPLICTSQGIDTSDDIPIGRLQLGILMAVAEFERSLIRERTKAGLVAARRGAPKSGGRNGPPSSGSGFCACAPRASRIRRSGNASASPSAPFIAWSNSPPFNNPPRQKTPPDPRETGGIHQATGYRTVDHKR